MFLFFAKSFAFVPRRGLEPPRIAPLVPKTSAYTNSATWAYGIILAEINKNYHCIDYKLHYDKIKQTVFFIKA